MPDMFSATVDTSGLLALLDRLGPSAEFVCKEVALDTAKRIVEEMRRRIKRASGDTAAGIHVDVSYDGTGFVVVMGDVVDKAETARRTKLGMKNAKAVLYGMKHTGLWLEFGTSKQKSYPFFFASAELESDGYRRRLEDRMQQFLDEVGR